MTAPESPSGPTRPETSYRIMVVDDSSVIRDLVKKVLSLFGYDIVEMPDGWQALLRLQQDRDFDLLIVDLAMPRLDGLSLIQRLRLDPAMPHYPILVLTGEDLNPDGSPPSGADALMIKPFLPSVLLKRVQALLSAAELAQAHSVPAQE